MTNHNNSWHFFTLISPMETRTISSNPLLSTIATLYILILLYFPHIFLKITFSPLLISTIVLLLSLLRLGATQGQATSNNEPVRAEARTRTQPNLAPEPGFASRLDHEPPSGPSSGPEPEVDCREQPSSEARLESEHEPESEPEAEEEMTRPEVHSPARPELGPKQSFVEWDVGAPLEVIYEAYEGEDDQNDAFSGSNIERYPSLSRYYPESDSESSSSSSSTSSSIRGEEKEGLIEIALDYDHDYGRDYDYNNVANDYYCGNNKVTMEKELIKVGQVEEEDSLIEIDISPTRDINCGFSW